MTTFMSITVRTTTTTTIVMVFVSAVPSEISKQNAFLHGHMYTTEHLCK